MYLSPEPMLNEAHFVRLESKAGQSVATYSYGANNPISNTDATGLFVRKNPCANWVAAIAIAQKWAGCKGGRLVKPNNECSYQLALNGACDICSYLEDGIGPDAFVRARPFGAGPAHTNATTLTGITYRLAADHPEKNSLLFDDSLCRGSAEDLAAIMIHEAAHYCAVRGNALIPDVNTVGSVTGFGPGTGTYFERVCRANAGGPILP